MKTTTTKCPECQSEIGHKILCKTGNDRAKTYQSKLRCTKAPIPYVEALAKERDQLRAKLNKVTAQCDELLMAARTFAQFVDAKKPIVHDTQITTLDKAGSEYCEFVAAITKAEQH